MFPQEEKEQKIKLLKYCQFLGLATRMKIPSEIYLKFLPKAPFHQFLRLL